MIGNTTNLQYSNNTHFKTTYKNIELNVLHCHIFIRAEYILLIHISQLFHPILLSFSYVKIQVRTNKKLLILFQLFHVRTFIVFRRGGSLGRRKVLGESNDELKVCNRITWLTRTHISGLLACLHIRAHTRPHACRDTDRQTEIQTNMQTDK